MSHALRRLRALNPNAPIADRGAGGRSIAGFLLADSPLPRPSPLHADAGTHVAGLATFTLTFDRPMPWRT